MTLYFYINIEKRDLIFDEKQLHFIEKTDEYKFNNLLKNSVIFT